MGVVAVLRQGDTKGTGVDSDLSHEPVVAISSLDRGDKVTFVADRAVLTEEACELSMEPGAGIHEGLVWCENPKLSWLPAHPMT